MLEPKQAGHFYPQENLILTIINWILTHLSCIIRHLCLCLRNLVASLSISILEINLSQRNYVFHPWKNEVLAGEWTCPLLELAGLSDRENEGSNNEEGWTMPNYVTAILPYFPIRIFPLLENMTVILNYFPSLQTLSSTFTLTSARNFILEVWLIANTEFLYTPPSASSISNFTQIASVFPHVLSLFQNPILFCLIYVSLGCDSFCFPVFKTLSFDYWLDSLQDVRHMGRPMSFSCLHGAYVF